MHSTSKSKIWERKSESDSDTMWNRRQNGRPPKHDATSISASSSSERATRSEIFDKEMWVICQKHKADKLHDVLTENMGAQLKAICQETDNKLLKVRLSNVIGTSDLLTVVTEDMKYHLFVYKSCTVRHRNSSQNNITKSHKTTHYFLPVSVWPRDTRHCRN